MREVGSIKQLAILLNRKPQTIQSWINRGMPTLQNGSFDLDACILWRDENLEKRDKGNDPKREFFIDVDDPELLDKSVSTDSLEELRKWKAATARLEFLQKTKELIPRAEVAALFSILAEQIKVAGENLQRRYGTDAQDIIDQALKSTEKRFTDEGMLIPVFCDRCGTQKITIKCHFCGESSI